MKFVITSNPQAYKFPDLYKHITLAEGANLLIEKLGEENIVLQQTEYPEVKGNKLKVRLDIEIFQNGMPLIILDTKYKEYDNTPDMGHIAQLSLYSLSTRVKNCGLIYPGKFEPEFFLIKPDIRVHILPFNLAASSKLEFEENCSQFVENLKSSSSIIVVMAFWF